MYAKYVELRDSKGLTDADVSKATGIFPSTFSDWKANRSTPKIEKLIKIADYFGITLDELVKGTS
jgi:repressor LexA